MSKVKVARSAGFCFGVSRSVKMAEEMLESGPCLSYGPLIHNDDVVSSLAERGLSVINSPADVRPGDRVLIRSHGISLAEEEALRRAGAEITRRDLPQCCAHTPSGGLGVRRRQAGAGNRCGGTSGSQGHLRQVRGRKSCRKRTGTGKTA